jgi:hypothetical protein
MRMWGSAPRDEGAPLSVKRGEWVTVDDVPGYQGRVVVVIGVTAVIQVACENGGGDTYRAAELRYCRPDLDDVSMDAACRSVRPGSAMPRGDRRVAR